MANYCKKDKTVDKIEGKYHCKKCQRIAKKEGHLCKPQKLKA
ncbi:MAG: hypothetical protein RQ866_08535 [Bacteroidales bacterium]|nr:hypothetical protein [Bacteroidales bacterium]